MSKKTKGRSTMAVLEKILDNRFSTDEMMPATELQDTAIAKLQDRVLKQHKVLLTHYSRPVGVLLDVEGFDALVTRVRELEELLEDFEAAKFIEDRLSRDVPEEQWLTQEQFADKVRALLLPPRSPK